MPNTTLLNAVKHAASGRQFQRTPQYQSLPNIAYTCSTAGWYQGSGYLILTALLNFHWARNPNSLNDPLNRAMAALVAIIAWSSSAWYLGRGLKVNGIATAAAGIFQVWAALH
ncbi:hypothetical protein PENANT_c031G03868 [Penicillium antarcticum]|uniref:Uncharacterized protein n=1 Tax=Penicillium antarcticum TaxID=416450 RepID=A0A1V6PVA2_9EURO|nr:hypothetical protein PENANT_c031G03868 [Penicillium antarcticum]